MIKKIEPTNEVKLCRKFYMKIYDLDQVHEFQTAFELEGFEGILKFAKHLSIPAYNIHLINDLTIVTEEDKIKRMNYLKSEFDFFPNYGKNIKLRDYFILNYSNLVTTALDYHKDKTLLDKAVLDSKFLYHKNVLSFCDQYENHFFNNNV